MLVSNWRAVLKHAWSIRLMILAALLSGAEVGLPLIDGTFDIQPGVFATLSAVTTAAAFVARLIAQNDVPPAVGAPTAAAPSMEASHAVV